MIDVYVNVNYIKWTALSFKCAEHTSLGKRMPDTFTIADLANEFGVTARTLRFYEDQQLLSPRRDGQNRIYAAADRDRLNWVLRAKRVGFSISEIRELLDLYNIGDDRHIQRSKTLEKCRERIVALEGQKQDIEVTIAELQDFCALLESHLKSSAKPAAE